MTPASDSTQWNNFSAGLTEGHRTKFEAFRPCQVDAPPCSFEVELPDGSRYECDGSNMFLLDKGAAARASGPDVRKIKKGRSGWISESRNWRVAIPLGWSAFMGTARLWLYDTVAIPGEIAAHVLWRYRDRAPAWRAMDPGKDDAKEPIAVYAGAPRDGTASRHPALAYLMPYPARSVPRWSEVDATPERTGRRNAT